MLDHDHNPPRFVRHVGWRTCMKCCDPYFSQDVIRLRICDGCKTPMPARNWSKKKTAVAPQREANSRSGARTNVLPRAEDKATVPR